MRSTLNTANLCSLKKRRNIELLNIEIFAKVIRIPIVGINNTLLYGTLKSIT